MEGLCLFVVCVSVVDGSNIEIETKRNTRCHPRTPSGRLLTDYDRCNEMLESHVSGSHVVYRP